MILLLASYPLKTNLSLILYSKKLEMSQPRALLEVILSFCHGTARFVGERRHPSLCRSFPLAGRGNSVTPQPPLPLCSACCHRLPRREDGGQTLHLLLAGLLESQPRTDPVPNVPKYLHLCVQKLSLYSHLCLLKWPGRLPKSLGVFSKEI